MTFRFFADISFDADNAEQAARKLADHLKWISESFSDRDASADPEPEPWFKGTMRLSPED